MQWLVELLHLVSQHQVMSSSWHSKVLKLEYLLLDSPVFLSVWRFFLNSLISTAILLTFCSVLAFDAKIESISDSSCWISVSVFCLNASIEADSFDFIDSLGLLLNLTIDILCVCNQWKTYQHQRACDYQFFSFSCYLLLNPTFHFY